MVLSALFNTVHHDILLSALNRKYGFQGNILSWVEIYLCPRHFKVCIGDTKSEFRQLNQLVPQGSVGGPILFNFYCSTITSVIVEELAIELGAFANDHNLRKTFKPSVLDKEKEALNVMELCLDNIIEWMNMNQLNINPTKTEFMYMASRWQIRKCEENLIRVGADMVERSAHVKLLDTWLDEHLLFEYHITQKCKNAMLSIYKIRNLRRYLSVEACQVLIHSLVSSHLDYCNSLLYGLPDCIIGKLQCVQNIAVKLLLNLGKRDSPQLAMYKLHWLRIRFRLEYKIALLMFRCHKGEAPKYLCELLDIDERTGISRSLRSYQEDVISYKIPFAKHETFAYRSFSVVGPRIWNGLHVDLLKTYLFCKCYSDLL